MFKLVFGSLGCRLGCLVFDFSFICVFFLEVKDLLEVKTQFLNDLTAQLIEEFDAVLDPGGEPSVKDTQAAWCVDALPAWVANIA